MEVGVELLALRLQALDAVAAEHAGQLPRRQFHALGENLERFAAAGALFGAEAADGAFEIVDHRQKVARESGDRVSARVRRLALGAAAHVLGFGQGAQGAVLEFGVFRNQLLDHHMRIGRGFLFDINIFWRLPLGVGRLCVVHGSPLVRSRYRGLACKNQAARSLPLQHRQHLALQRRLAAGRGDLGARQIRDIEGVDRLLAERDHMGGADIEVETG